MADPTLEAARKLRAYEAEHPFQAVAMGFTPGVGEASAAAALRDPDAPWWEKALNVPGLLPSLGGLSKGLVAGVKGAKPAAEAAVLLASKLRKTAPDLFEKASKFIDPFTGKKMAEIDDSLSSVDKEYIDQALTNQIPLRLDEAYNHPDLFRAEPNLGYVPVTKGGVSPGAAGEYRFSSKLSPDSVGDIAIAKLPDPTSSRSLDFFDNTIRHETQHATDDLSNLLTSGEDKGLAYWADPQEIRARVVAERHGMSPSGRVKYSFDQHMKDELARLEGMDSMGLKLGHATKDDLRRMAGMRNLDWEDLLRK